jgi:hypothetical protein
MRDEADAAALQRLAQRWVGEEAVDTEEGHGAWL